MNPANINSLAAIGSSSTKVGALSGSSWMKFLVQSHIIKGLGMGSGMVAGMGISIAGVALLAGGIYWLNRQKPKGE
jgi:hypothetical protein